MGNKEQLVKFIIKSIVSDVEYDVNSDKFTINRIDISEELINDIIAEGAKYGLNADETRELITIVSSDIKIAPSIHRSYSNTETTDIKTGNHLKLVFNQNNIGPVYIEIICIETGRFFVINSNVPGLKFQDELVSINRIWNISYDVDFIIYRNGKNYPDKQSALRLNKLQSIEYFLPSVIHEILDSKKEFTKEELEEESIVSNTSNGTIIQYLWEPQSYAPIVFSLSEQEVDQTEEALFLVKRKNSKSRVAKISINPGLLLPLNAHQQQYLLDTLIKCCDINNSEVEKSTSPVLLKNIRTVRPGKLQKEAESEVWVLVEKPLISIAQ